MMQKYSKISIFLCIFFVAVDAQEVDPKLLLNPANAEVVPWYLCAKEMKEQGTSDWSFVFGQCILTFLGKNDDMHAVLQEAFARVQDQSISPVYINHKNKIISGHADVAVALACKRKVSCVIVDDDDPGKNMLTYAKEQGLGPHLHDLFVLEYIRLNTKCFTFIVWPKGAKHLPHIKKRLSSLGVVAFEKKFQMKQFAPYLFVRQITNKKPKADWFVNIYFRSKPLHPVSMTLLVLETEKTPREVNQLKLRIREEVRYPFCMHGDDNNQQGVITCEMILDHTTYTFLDNVNVIPSVRYEAMIHNFLRELRKAGYDRQDYCIVNFDTMLQSNTIEYITSKQALAAPEFICKNDSYSQRERDEFLYNSDATFYYFYAKCKAASILTKKNDEIINTYTWSLDDECFLDYVLSGNAIFHT